jgi:BON domain
MRRRRRLRFLGTALLGATVAYFFDPDRGRSRRARVVDQAQGRLRWARRRAVGRSHDVANRLAGWSHELVAQPHPPTDDRELVQKVRSEVLGRSTFRELNVVVDAYDGMVHLRGSVPPDVAQELVGAVAAVDTVRGIENLLHAPGEPAPNKAAAIEASHEAAEHVAPPPGP